MNIGEVDKLATIRLDHSFSFNEVDASSISLVGFHDEGVSEVNVYSTSLGSLKRVEDFIAGYLKLLYMELFDGEPKEELEDAYLEVVSTYELKLDCLAIREFLDGLLPYLGKENLKDLESNIQGVKNVFRCHEREELYLLVSPDKIFFVECEHE